MRVKEKTDPKRYYRDYLAKKNEKSYRLKLGKSLRKNGNWADRKRGEIVGKTELAKAYVQIIPSAKGIGGGCKTK